MIISFTGDICFGDVDKFTITPFINIGKKLSQLNCVVNLEAPFLPDGDRRYPEKSKISLRSYDNSVRYLKQINPLLSNLSNNHINDFGNFGSENTMRVLQHNDLNYFGAGLPGQDHNRFVIENKKILLLSYTTRSVDLSGTKLFEDERFIGPKEYSLKLVQQQLATFKNYKKIVLFHWGVEDIHYPIPEQVVIGRELIDAGVDLIIGNHSHVIQSFEKYKGKWIFYCLGHLYFPHFESKYLDKQGIEQTSWDIHDKHRNTSIIPVFEINAHEIKLLEILTIQTKEKFEPYFVDASPRFNTFLFKNILLYRTFYIFCKKMVYLSRLPYRFTRKIRRFIRKAA